MRIRPVSAACLLAATMLATTASAEDRNINVDAKNITNIQTGGGTSRVVIGGKEVPPGTVSGNVRVGGTPQKPNIDTTPDPNNSQFGQDLERHIKEQMKKGFEEGNAGGNTSTTVVNGVTVTNGSMSSGNANRAMREADKAVREAEEIHKQGMDLARQAMESADRMDREAGR